MLGTSTLETLQKVSGSGRSITNRDAEPLKTQCQLNHLRVRGGAHGGTFGCVSRSAQKPGQVEVVGAKCVEVVQRDIGYPPSSEEVETKVHGNKMPARMAEKVAAPQWAGQRWPNQLDETPT